MSVLFKTLAFSLGLTLFFTLVTYLLPQVKGEAPVEKEVDLGSLTMESFIALGEEIFHNKGTCTLCHQPAPLGRAPDIAGEDMVALANKHLADERYQGDAKNAEEYIRESLLHPGKYVVAGWGKKGSNDTESPMPMVDKPPIQLTPIEVDAVIAWLQAKDGGEVTVALPAAEAAAEVASAVAGDEGEKAPAPAATAEEALTKYACASCHAMDSRDTLVGPSLLDVGSRLSKAQLRQSIVDPNAVVAEGFPPAMPSDFASKMTVSELEMIVNYLAEKKG
ncbi:c-type cytochrome [Thiolapillus sp.]